MIDLMNKLLGFAMARNKNPSWSKKERVKECGGCRELSFKFRFILNDKAFYKSEMRKKFSRSYSDTEITMEWVMELEPFKWTSRNAINA